MAKKIRISISIFGGMLFLLSVIFFPNGVLQTPLGPLSWSMVGLILGLGGLLMDNLLSREKPRDH